MIAEHVIARITLLHDGPGVVVPIFRPDAPARLPAPPEGLAPT